MVVTCQLQLFVTSRDVACRVPFFYRMKPQCPSVTYPRPTAEIINQPPINSQLSTLTHFILYSFVFTLYSFLTSRFVNFHTIFPTFLPFYEKNAICGVANTLQNWQKRGSFCVENMFYNIIFGVFESCKWLRMSEK